MKNRPPVHFSGNRDKPLSNPKAIKPRLAPEAQP